ncbi:hypothetical protein [Flavobacterium lacus]|jgi:hypothetical protein|uniref:Uncharacterized protein n=1 Tax=Flavobacterium lacus TaxID=1353778 RepID=A0A328WUH7_9FLAO|nr:hypothetical protein [Flavobacterium lacus]RAR49813.1 hypothetical protein B0I10_103234 [Flavobacterium lacus]
MEKTKFILLLFCIVFISCGENIEKNYESDRIKIIYKVDNNFISEKKINLDFSSKDTILQSNGLTFKEIKDVFSKSVNTKINDFEFTSSDKFDFMLLKKDSLLTSNTVYKEFELFLLKEKLARKVTK